jgi:hypothetical protein
LKSVCCQIYDIFWLQLILVFINPIFDRVDITVYFINIMITTQTRESAGKKNTWTNIVTCLICRSLYDHKNSNFYTIIKEGERIPLIYNYQRERVGISYQHQAEHLVTKDNLSKSSPFGLSILIPYFTEFCLNQTSLGPTFSVRNRQIFGLCWLY